LSATFTTSDGLAAHRAGGVEDERDVVDVVLARMLESQVSWAESLKVASRLPLPGVLSALEAHR
jgi:hypothetical protein